MKKLIVTLFLIIFSLFSFATDFFKVTTDVNLRSGPGTEYTVLFELKTGDEVEFISHDNEWDVVSYNGQNGYVSSEYLQFSRTTDITKTPELDKETETDNTFIIIAVILGVILILIVLIINPDKKRKQQQTTISSPPVVTQQQSKPTAIVTQSMRSVSVTGKCPYCAEEINKDAIKCKHCGEFFNSEIKVVSNQAVQSTTIIIHSPKNVGVAIILTFLFGPIGLFYSSITGGLIMTLIMVFTPLILFVFLFIGVATENLLTFYGSGSLLFIGFWVCWLICIIWAAVAATNYNDNLK